MDLEEYIVYVDGTPLKILDMFCVLHKVAQHSLKYSSLGAEMCCTTECIISHLYCINISFTLPPRVLSLAELVCKEYYTRYLVRLVTNVHLSMQIWCNA